MVRELADKIKKKASSLAPTIVALRREIHAHPELSFEEKNTSERIQHFLTTHQISFTSGWAGHGIVATIKGNHTGPSIMLRADMDALPIQEENDIPYKSLHAGIMHACGHDVHTTSLLGAAAILRDFQDVMRGEVKMIFQPGEEKLPGGASIMIKEGLFKEKPEWIIGQHVYPPLPAGHVGFKDGLYMASSDELYVTIRGKGGHAATPHLCIDPILMAGKVVVALQELISRNQDPMSPAVLSIGKIYSDGGATNVIPEKVYLEGTFRAMDEKWRNHAHHLIRQLILNTCRASGGDADIRIEIGYPSLSNDPAITGMCRDAAVTYLGEDKVHTLPPRMSSEDFAFYTHQVPASFYRLGTGWADSNKNFPVHSNRFDIDELALETGMGLMAYIALSYIHIKI
ncbi:MAG: M20 family metallopeptidase [Bacteroidota bacterium]|nr:M20 family metallopeptidase [Bacteroidota bacterium]